MLSQVEQLLLVVMILVLMFGMGATLTLNNFKYALSNPKGVLIGFVSQFGVMPALAFGLSHLLGLPPEQAIALILVGCLPGGTTSNLFTYFSRGNVALSIAMTTASTIAAVLMMPILLGFYAQGYVAELSAVMVRSGGQAFTIDNTKIVASLVVVLIPVSLGMVLKRFSASKAKIAEKIGSVMGILVIVFIIGTWVPKHHELLLGTPWSTYAGAVLIGICGFSLGYILAFLSKLPARDVKTVALETGIQNGPLSFGIIIATFQDQVQDKILLLPLLYGILIIFTSSFATLFFRRLSQGEPSETREQVLADTTVPSTR